MFHSSNLCSFYPSFFFLFFLGPNVVFQCESTSETHYPSLTVAWRQGDQPCSHISDTILLLRLNDRSSQEIRFLWVFLQSIVTVDL